MSDPGHCAHCGAAIASEDALERYCCQGCALAAAIIAEAGLDRYYAERDALPDRPGAPSRGWEQVAVDTLADGSCRARLALDGLHCASCVWVSEHVMAATPGVSRATVSYATGNAEVEWDPQRSSLDEICRRVSAIGYRPRPLHQPAGADRSLLIRLGVAAFAAGNAMMFAVPLYLGWWEGIEDRYAALFRWGLLVLATPVALWAAIPFYRGALAGIRTRVPHVDLPVSLGILALYLHGLVSTLRGQEAYLDSLCMLVALLLAGRVADQGRRRRAVDAAFSLASEAPRVARRRGPLGPEELSPELLSIDDQIEIAAGEEIAADGQILSGHGRLRMALLTGESEPVAVEAGDRVVAGAVLIEGSLLVKVEATAAQSLLQRMASELRRAADRPVEPGPADRLAPDFTLGVLGFSLLAWLGHAGFGGWGAAAQAEAWKAAIAVLVVACPCALALAGPLCSAAGLGAAARRGLLLRSGEVLGRLADIDLVVLDKTGTITLGNPELLSADDEILRIAAGLERNSNHPIARSVVSAAQRRGLPIPVGELAVELPGRGLVGRVDGQTWTLASAGQGRVGLWRGDSAEGSPAGELVFDDQPRADAARTLTGIRALGLDLVLLTGDHAAVAEKISAQVGLSSPIAAAGPEQKRAWIAARRAEGRRVLFVGDGLNDGLALGEADVGLAMGGGAASSVLVADGVVSGEALGPVLAGLAAARLATRARDHSLRWSLAYNVLAVALAAAGYVNPLVAAILMPLSSGLVLGRAARIEAGVAALLAQAPPSRGAPHARHPDPGPHRPGPWPGLPDPLPAGGQPGSV